MAVAFPEGPVRRWRHFAEVKMNRVFASPAISMLLSDSLGAEDPVHFVDAKLKAAVEEELWISEPTPSDMLGLISLYAESQGITNLEGLEYAVNLESLDLARNQITDISALAGLHNLQTLIVNNNAATNVSALSNLHSLRELDIHDNGIRDISALSGLSTMQTLILRRNPICNLSALSGVNHLRSQAGRWDPKTGAWVRDTVTSPCIDAGDPESPVGREPFPNGGIINMGAYGGTANASKSSLRVP